MDAPPAAQPLAAARSGGVLIVEDDEDLRNSLAEVLGLVGAAPCVCVGSVAELEQRGPEALACRLALLDVNLGAGAPSGVDACRWLGQRGFAGRLVFLTGHARSDPLVAKACTVHGTELLVKPIDFESLGRLVAEAAP